MRMWELLLVSVDHQGKENSFLIEFNPYICPQFWQIHSYRQAFTKSKQGRRYSTRIQFDLFLGCQFSFFSSSLFISWTEIAQVVPMDGFHYTKAELDAMPNPKEGRLRRGAPFTFNSHKLFQALSLLHSSSLSISFPSFDHGHGDPVEDDVIVLPKHKIVLVEGNYLGLNEEAISHSRSNPVSPHSSSSSSSNFPSSQCTTISQYLECGVDARVWASLWFGEKEEWESIPSLFDALWSIDCAEDTIVERCLFAFVLFNFIYYDKHWLRWKL